MLQMSMFSRLLIGVVSLTMAVTPRGAMADIRIADPEVRPVEPYRGLAYSAEDIAEVRRLARQGIHPELVEQVFTESATWMAMSDEQIIDLVPDADAAFAYGFAGDPKTDQAWARHGRGGICSLDRPGTVRSPHTGDIYGNEQPGDEYYDPGDGWVRPSDGKRFYFKGIWNGYIVREFHHAVNCLAVNYLLTGDPAIAERALLILDQMATLRSARPEDDGPIDYVVAPRPGKGYFSVTGNQANEHTVYVALAFDLLAKAPYAAEPSSYDPDVTVFDNIRQNFFDVYEMWYMETKVSISNHPLMVLANMTAQGVLFGRDDYLRPAIEGTYAFLDGTINRDGDYYEHSTYGHLGRDYGAVMTMLLSRYDPARYDDPDAMPDPSDYPHELNFGNDPRWFAYCSDMLFRLPVAGHDPQYGDIGANRNILLDETRYWLARRRETSLRMLSGIVTRPDWKRHVEQLYAAIPPQDRAEPTLKHVLLYGLSQWRQPPAHDPAAAELLPGSDFMPGKGIAILRSGDGKDRRGLFIRGGSNNHHGHDDQMAVIPYGHGMLLSGDYGYSISGTNDHVGWGTRAISHLTATINEDRPAPYMYKGWQRGRPSPAADLTGFMPTPPAQFVEMSNPGLWHHVADDVQDYRRFAAMVDVDAERYYFLDVFQIIGGNVHDYTWNAPYPNRESDDDNFTVAGIDPQARPNVWTLASLGGKHANAKWNQPGQSWGERLNGAGDGQIRDIGLNDLPKEIYKWNPPPGNGYGFIWDVKTDATQNDWTATWKLHDDKHFLRAHIINHDGMTAVTARSPSLLIDRHHHVIVARRDQPVDAQGPLRSRFVSVVEVGADDAWPVHEARKLKMEAEDANHAVAVQVDLATGDRDIFLVSRIGQTITSEAVTLQGRLGFARFDDADQLMHLAMQDGTSIEAGNWRLEIDTARFQATIRDVAADWNQSRLTIDQPLPTGTVLKGSMVLVDTPPDAAHPYSHNGYYAIEHVESAADGGSTLVFENQSLIATRLTVDTRDDTENTLHTVWPNALATMPGAHDFDGRMILKRDQPEMRTLVTDFVKRDVTVLDTQGFQPGDHLDVYVAKSGDRLEMPTTVSLTRQGNGRYLLRTNTRVTLTVTGSPGDALIAQVEGDAPRRLTSADAQGTLTATIDPAELGSASVLLSLQSR